MTILAFLAQKASKVIISLFSGFWDSSMKMRGPFLSKGGTQSWPGTAIVNHPLRQQRRRRLSYFPYIFYFVNFTISAAIRQGLFGSFENVIKEFPKFCDFRKFFNFLRGFLTLRIDQKCRFWGVTWGRFKDFTLVNWIIDKSWHVVKIFDQKFSTFVSDFVIFVILRKLIFWVVILSCLRTVWITQNR